MTTPTRPFTRVVVRGKTAYCSGQIGDDPNTGQLDADLKTQIRQALCNLAAELEKVGFTLTDLVQVKIYLTTMRDYSVMNEVYCDFFSDPFPARTCVAVLELPTGRSQGPIPALFEVDAIAEKE
ncbi:MAG TPA: RidA family protein [Candidatus Saccharimonadia bacterium]|jgi:2-iminobutanoate/2-iminopropanoate deaminase|nr:RidA family protein [Candidatus Saccharimonadia bacterium]